MAIKFRQIFQTPEGECSGGRANSALNARGVGGTPYSGPYGEAPRVGGRENCHFSIRKGHKISYKEEEMVVKAKCIKGCRILAEMTSQLNQND